MSKETTLATFKIDPVIWDSFKVWATTHGTNAAESLRFLIAECLAGRVDIPAGGESNHQAIAGIDERIATQLNEQIAALEFRLDERTSERLGAVWAELTQLKGQIEQLQKSPLSESSVANESEAVDMSPPAREQICLPIEGLPEAEPIATAAVEGSARVLKPEQIENGVPHQTVTNWAKKMGLVIGQGETVVQFWERRGWRREGLGNDSRWFQN
jgi:hypothetical protein